MRLVDLLSKKRDGGILTREEIHFIVKGCTDNTIPDYQLSAWLMAVYFQGMNTEEVSNLTMEMAHSGETVDLSSIQGIKVDKHSTGGVGDTTTLVLGPLVAACGIPVAKMSGRGLGHTGGTLDKLEAIPGFHIELSTQQFIDNVNHNQLAVIGQSKDLAPADKKLYALRDVTATVGSIPLIASSIMSKKIAAGADAIVLDVKTGTGAFMKTEAEAEALAQAMVNIGSQLGRQTIALISDMSQPLGYAIGNALEVREAIETLQGRGPADLTELSLTLGAHMLVLGGGSDHYEAAYKKLQAVIENGEALAKMKQFVDSQGGSTEVIDNPALLPQAKYQIAVVSRCEGYVESIHSEEIGIAAMLLGAGRATQQSTIDLSAGIQLIKKTGDYVMADEPLAIMHTNNQNLDAIHEKIISAFAISNRKPQPTRLIYKTIHH